jgi:twitching motility protein PilU
MDTLDWQAALKNAMRQAPDCILIGEIRDKETMQAAIAYAQTGHLCLATLHANNSYHAMNRIISFFPLENRPALFLDLSVALRAVISQRLVKKPDGVRAAACEIMLNTRHISELIERGEVQAIKEAMEQTLAPGSQTFEQDLRRCTAGARSRSTRRMANADSPTKPWPGWSTIPKAMPATGKNETKTPHRWIREGQRGPSFDEFKLHLADHDEEKS